MLGHKLMQIEGCPDLKKTWDLKVCRKPQVFHITIWKVYCRLQMAISWLDFWFCRVQYAHTLNWCEATNLSFNPWISNFTMTEMNVNQTNFLCISDKLQAPDLVFNLNRKVPKRVILFKTVYYSSQICFFL